MNIKKSDMVVVEDVDYVQIYVNGETHVIHGHDELLDEDAKVEIHSSARKVGE